MRIKEEEGIHYLPFSRIALFFGVRVVLRAEWDVCKWIALIFFWLLAKVQAKKLFSSHSLHCAKIVPFTASLDWNEILRHESFLLVYETVNHLKSIRASAWWVEKELAKVFLLFTGVSFFFYFKMTTSWLDFKPHTTNYMLGFLGFCNKRRRNI